jgi:hypothetical protein
MAIKVLSINISGRITGIKIVTRNVGQLEHF